MADVVRTCANCGNVQASGDFCEKCGTRMPAAPAPGPASAYAASQAPLGGPAAPPPAYVPQAPYGAPAGAPPQYGYPPEHYRSPRPGIFDFAGTMSRSTLKLLWWVVLGVIGLYVLFSIILVAMEGGKYAVMAFFISLFAAGFMFVAGWVLFEGIGIAMRLRDKAEK